MLLIGEKLNSSIPKTLAAMQSRNEDDLIALIRAQESCGAAYLDVNTALLGEEEIETMLWVVGLVQRYASCGIMVDTQNPEAVRAVLPKLDGRPAILNSVSPGKQCEELIGLLRECDAGVVCLPMGEAGVPHTAQERLKAAQALCEELCGSGIPAEKLYVDVLAQALSTWDSAAVAVLETLAAVKAGLPGVKTVCGLSNISFGLPRRGLLNRTLLTAALYGGLDAAILDVTSAGIRETLAACGAVFGQDEYCLEYIGFVRENGR